MLIGYRLGGPWLRGTAPYRFTPLPWQDTPWIARFRDHSIRSARRPGRRRGTSKTATRRSHLDRHRHRAHLPGRRSRTGAPASFGATMNLPEADRRGAKFARTAARRKRSPRQNSVQKRHPIVNFHRRHGCLFSRSLWTESNLTRVSGSAVGPSVHLPLPYRGARRRISYRAGTSLLNGRESASSSGRRSPN